MRVLLYGREGCSLCESAIDMLEAVGPALGLEWESLDVDADPGSARLYGQRVPVVIVAGVVVLEGRFDERDIARIVAQSRASDSLRSGTSEA